MTNEVTCEGKLMLCGEQGVWRAKQWSSDSTRCSFALLYKQNTYRLEARDRATKEAAMFFPLDQVKEYVIVDTCRQQVQLQDGRCFTMLLAPTEQAEVFKNQVRKALKVCGKTRRSLAEDEECPLLMGPPISDTELRQEAFRRTKRQQSLDELDGKEVDMRHRPLPPIPKIEDDYQECEDIYEDINEFRMDELTLLQDAIMLGHVEEAGKWAKALAKQRKVLFISSGVDMQDIVNYLPGRRQTPLSRCSTVITF